MKKSNRNPLDFNFKVRFHLGKGDYFMSWRIERMSDNQVWFIDPNQVSLQMEGCFLRNRKTASVEIYKGGNKTVCAWIECKRLNMVLREFNPPSGMLVSYNPKVAPNWLLNRQNADYKVLSDITTWGNKLFTQIPPEKIAGAAPVRDMEGFVLLERENKLIKIENIVL